MAEKTVSLRKSASYVRFLEEIKDRIQQAQLKANLAVNRELVLLYWQIGRLITERQADEGWGTKVVNRLATDIRNEVPEIKGFSARNLNRMKAFYAAYPILPQAGAKLLPPDGKASSSPAQLAAVSLQIPWRHNILLIEKVKDPEERLWYMQKTIEHGWSRAILMFQIQGKRYQRQGKATTNFELTLPPAQSDLARQSLKDPYIFDFLTLDTELAHRKHSCGERQRVPNISTALE